MLNASEPVGTERYTNFNIIIIIIIIIINEWCLSHYLENKLWNIPDQRVNQK